MENPYKLVNISNINVHYGNGAKNKLKEVQNKIDDVFNKYGINVFTA